MPKKKTTVLKYILIALGIFLLSVIIAIVTRMALVADTAFLQFSDSQAGLVTSMIEGAVGAIAASLVFYQLKVGDSTEKQQNEIEEAKFLLQFNQSFIQDPNMSSVEHCLECCGIYKTISDNELITDENRQRFINYLVYLESLAPLVLRGILKLEYIDDLMAYRFFLAVNNPALQRDQLFQFPEYYRGCFKLYAVWRDYRKTNDYEILMEDTGLDKWSDFEKYAKSK